jgi:hypothetical protein
MRIAINHRFGAYEYQEGYAVFSGGVAGAMAAQHPENEYFLLTDQAPYSVHALAPNQHWITGGPPARHPLLWKAWYDFRVPAMLRSCKADVFLSPDGFCSLNTRTPQVMVIHDLAFLHHPHLHSSGRQSAWSLSVLFRATIS